MATELVTNAVMHAQTPCCVTIDVDEARVRVDVCDESATMPEIGPMPNLDATKGRGLALVAQLADRWGCDAVPGGKSVWFEAASGTG